MYEPVIKWSGSKRSQAEQILKCFPTEINTYYEPFCGGAAVLRRLLDSNIQVKHYVCSDINNGLIDLWNEIINHPDLVCEHYRKLWNELNKDDNKQRKKKYFTSVRERYNQEHNPLDFMFLMRTAINGMPRYNSSGNFNTSFHITRNGIIPETLEKIVFKWSELLQKNNVRFICCSYEDIKPKENDFVYLDPPYAHTNGMYYGCIDYDKFWEWIRKNCKKYILSFDGKSNNRADNTYKVPTDIYSKHEYIYSGNSGFRRINNTSNNTIIYESLYIK